METTPKIGSVGQRVAKQVARMRGRIPVRELSSRLAKLGRPILPSGITKLEQGQRRIDVDDLVALAIALEVTPTRLLLGPPPIARSTSAPEDPDVYEYSDWPSAHADRPHRLEFLRLAPEVAVETWEAWTWATGSAPLGEVWRLTTEDHITHQDPERELAEFQSENQIPPMRMMLGHAADVQEAITDIDDAVKDALDQGLTGDMIEQLTKAAIRDWARDKRVEVENEKRYRRMERGMNRRYKPRPKATDQEDDEA